MPDGDVHIQARDLRGIRSLDDVLDFLSEELDWPIDSGSLEEASFEYEVAELGISADQAPSLERINQLRPLVTNQPWGIFFLEFSGPRLPITPLRRLLQGLLRKKRAQGDGSRKTWDLDHLLFIVTTDSGESVEIHFLAFFDEDGALPQIRSIPWRPDQSPEQHLRRIAEELLPHLAWPEEVGEAELWRTDWERAFRVRHGEAIGSATRLASRMAVVAQELRDQVEKALSHEGGQGALSELLADVRRELVADVDERRFADMCAQTLVYGTLTSRVTDPEGFGAAPTLATFPLSNPFLAAFFEQVHDQIIELGLEEDGLEGLVADLRASNVEAVLDQFGSTAKGGDPVIHFYEEFLAEYDRRMRADAGAFYTPSPVVSFMIRSVDEVLRSRYGLVHGIADSTSWQTIAKRLDTPLPQGVAPDTPFVSMLDPATGTGTFLVEWLRRAHESFGLNRPLQDWQARLEEHVLPSMHAFELMLAPYAISHLKVALELENQNAPAGLMAQILLTDTLDYPPPAERFGLMEDPVAAEGERATSLKRDRRYSIIIGNPPYDREQRPEALDVSSRRKGGVVRYGVQGIEPLLSSVIDPLRAAGLGRHAKNLYNDYVYFWRWAVWQATERLRGPGIVALITAASYLDGQSFGGLRSLLREAFEELWIIDLGGEGRGAQVEENVFDIRTPVAICIGARYGGDVSPATVHHTRLIGSREEKLSALANASLSDDSFVEVRGSGLAPFTPRTNSPYNSWPLVTDLFPLVFPGTKAGRTWVIGPTRSLLRRRLEALMLSQRADKAELFKNSPTGRKVDQPLGRTNMPGSWDVTPVAKMRSAASLQPYAYRSFDRQFVVADPRFLDRASIAWGLAGPNQVFLTTLTTTRLGAGPAMTSTPYVPDLDHFRGSFGAKNVIPAYLDSVASRPNVVRGFIDALSSALEGSVSGDDLIAYVYGLTGTGAFTARFVDELSEGAGPVRIPLTAGLPLFRKICGLGQELLWLHSWGERFAASRGNFPQPEATERIPIRTYPTDFEFIEEHCRLMVGDGTFESISPEVWGFEVSGLQVLRSWLGYRMQEGKGRRSSPLDEIRSQRWSFTEEMLSLIAILEQTIALTPKAASLLESVVDGPLIDASLLPAPSDDERKPPKL